MRPPTASMQHSRLKAAVAAVALLLLIAACGDEEEKRAPALICTAAYRVSVTEPLTEVDSMRFEDAQSEQSLPYIYLELHAEYAHDRTEAERSLRVWVTRTAEDEPIVTHLYQLPQDNGPQNQFLGDHGFTGLMYAYDPISGAELQYWCAAE